MANTSNAENYLNPLHELADEHPVLFVPGALTGEWIWENNFREFFEKQGFVTHAMSFSGHDSPFYKRNTLKFKNYLDECISAIRSLDKPPIIVAHSLGGLIALHAAANVDVHSMVLLSPVPHTGVVGSLSKLGLKSPLSLLKFATVVVDARVAKFASPPIGIYSETCDEEDSKELTQRLRSESLPVMLRLLSPPKLNLSRLKAERILFMAATGDFIIPPSEVLKSAEHVGSPFKVYEGLSHSFQVERTWPRLAGDMLEWLVTLDQPSAEARGSDRHFQVPLGV